MAAWAGGGVSIAAGGGGGGCCSIVTSIGSSVGNSKLVWVGSHHKARTVRACNSNASRKACGGMCWDRVKKTLTAWATMDSF
jgi:hypothetical protein